jgi:hypothetical protein
VRLPGNSGFGARGATGELEYLIDVAGRRSSGRQWTGAFQRVDYQFRREEEKEADRCERTAS